MTTPGAPSVEPLRLRFHDLMPFRVREILLVSSPYDFFILEEDGGLTERIFSAYSELNLPAAPRITHAPIGATALKLLAERRFDLVLTMVRLGDMDVTAFGRSVKELDPRMPVVLLALTEADLRERESWWRSDAVDLTFLWTGDTHILLAIIKQVEDRLNVAHDTATEDVRVMVVVEDAVGRYSHLLSILYSELMAQSQSLIAEGLNDLQRLVRMRARPKLLLARTFEEAVGFCRQYRDQLLALITDVRLPRGGAEDPSAGLDLVRLVRAEDESLPVLLQTTEPDAAHDAAELGVACLDKNTNLRRQIRSFMVTNLGFGEFVFRRPDGSEVARATGMFEMEHVLQNLPAASLEYHASRNHISLWLMARSMFGLAKEIRQQRLEFLGGVEHARQWLVAALREARLQEQGGTIADFSAGRGAPQLVRLGTGSVGGKGRGLAFAQAMLARHRMAERFPGMEIRVPRTVLLGTDYFDQFVDESSLPAVIDEARPDAEIIGRFLAPRLPAGLEEELRAIHEALTGPLAVRSSSLLEDSHSKPFAGIYATYIVPNNHPDRAARFAELLRAIKAVYASTYCANARSYVAGLPSALEHERMGVVIQEMVGQAFGDRFYPALSGVALSYNYYPIGSQRAEEGLVAVAVGLGQIIVQGGAALQFSPPAPTVLPQFSSPRDFLQRSQQRFLALDLNRTEVDFRAGPEASLRRCGLEDLEQDGVLAAVGSVYVAGEDRLRDRLDVVGPRVVTFNNILKWKAIPLAPALEELLRLFRRGLGCAVELEFAVDLGDYGRTVARGQERVPPRLHVLQVRPQGVRLAHEQVDLGAFATEELLCRTRRLLGHGVINDLCDVVYVTRRDLGHRDTARVAAQIGGLNASLVAAGRPYLLVGPGRWGSSDPALGIPVVWSQISGARVIVETEFHGRAVEPSQGAHFFHNIVSFETGYLTVAATRPAAERSFIDLEWLAGQPARAETPEVRHVRVAQPLQVFLDSRQGVAVIVKPSAA